MNDPCPLGRLVVKEDERDAVHVAIISVKAREELQPGQEVSLAEGEPVCGIVDPFLKEPVPKGEIFWLLMFPNTITGMKHRWTHPAVKEQVERPNPALDPEGESKRWLENFAKEARLGYLEMIDITKEYAESGEVWVQHGSDDARDAFYANESAFWRHMERAEGIRCPEDDPSWASPFTCSC